MGEAFLGKGDGRKLTVGVTGQREEPNSFATRANVKFCMPGLNRNN